MADEPAPKGARHGRADEPVPSDPPDLFAIKIDVTPQNLTELLSEFALDVGDRPHVEPRAEGAGTLYAFAPEGQIREIEAAGYRVETGENVSEAGRQRMAEVGEGDRFEGGRIPPRGLGHKPGRIDHQGDEPKQGGRVP
jgi:hypothetical protein